MNNEAIKQVISVLMAHYPYRYKDEDLNKLGQRIGAEFGDVSGRSFLYVLESRASESRNPVDLNEIHRRAKMLDDHYLRQYEIAKARYLEHLNTPPKDFRPSVDFFSMFGAECMKTETYESKRTELKGHLNEAIKNLPDEIRTTKNIKEVY